MIAKDLKLRIEKLIGAKIESDTFVQGGYTPAKRLRCDTTKGSFFVKVGTTALTRKCLRREIHVYNQIRGDFMPHLVAWEDHETEPLLIMEDLSTCHWPPPWEEKEIDLALAQIDRMHGTDASLESFAEINGAHESNWQTVALDHEPLLSLGMVDEQWLESALPALLTNERRCKTEGDSLCHWDLRSDNMCLNKDRAVFIDWNLACLSNPKLDLGFWLPSLAYEGGPQPETLLPDAPEVAAWVSGFFAARAGLPQISDAPGVRLVQRRQLETALPWAIRELDLPPL